MAKNNRHNAAFVVGSVLGGLVGAAVALWKTPYSGEEIRTRISGAPQSPASSTGEVQHLTVAPTQGRSLKDKMLSTVESTLAPVVGVELGKTANDSGAVVKEGLAFAAKDESHGVSEGVGEPPAEPDAGSGINEPYFETGGTANMTPVDDSSAVPSNLSSPTRAAGDGEAASVEELTTPQVNRVPDALQQQDGTEMQPFPKLGGDKSS